MAFRVSGLALALPRWDLNRTWDGPTKKNSSCYAALLLSFNQQCYIWVYPMEDSPSYGRKRENDQPSKVSMGRWQSSLANVMQLLYVWMAVYVYITRYMSISMWICIIICYMYIDMYIHTYIHYIALHYITLHYITLHYIIYIALHYITLHCITLHYITLYTLHYITLHYIALHYITLHYITLHTYIYIYIYIHIYIYTKYEQQISSEIVYAWCSLIATDFASGGPGHRTRMSWPNPNQLYIN